MNRARLIVLLPLVLALPFVAACPKKPAPATGRSDARGPHPRPEAMASPTPGKLVAGHTAFKVALPEPGNPVVAVRLAFRSGSADDPQGKEGLTRLTARLMAEGGTRALTSSELIRALYPLAAELDVQVDREMTVFVGRVHKDHLATFLPIFADVVVAPRMDPKEFERLKTDALNDLTLRLRTSDDENLGKEALESMLAPGHGYAHPPVGTESGLASLTLQDVESHRRSAFGKARVIVGIAGGFDGKSLGDLEGRVATLPAGAPPIERPAPRAPEARNALIVEKPAASTAVSLGFNTTVKRGDPDFPALRLAMGWLGEHRQQVGRLFNEIREERGMNYGDYAYAEEFVQEGGSRFPLTNIARRHQHVEVWLRPVETKNAAFALRAALWNIEGMMQRGIPQAEFESTRDYLSGYSRLWEQTTDRRLGNAIDDLYYGGGTKWPASFRKALETMTAEDVNAAIKKHLAGRPMQIAFVTGDGKALAATLTSGKPTPIVYDSPKPEEVKKEDQAIEAFPLDLTQDRVKVVPSSELFK